MEARALASIGDARACAAVLHRAEQAFDRGNPGEDPEWIGFFDAWEVAGEAAHCFQDLGRAWETRLFVAQAIDRSIPRRGPACLLTWSARQGHYAGDLDQAISLATDAVERAGALQSLRCAQYVADFHASLMEKNAAHPSVRAFTELVKITYPALWTPGSS
jgi:hypothetical protein